MMQKWSKEAGVSDYNPIKVNFRAKNSIRDREELYKMIERSTHQEDRAIINGYIPNKICETKSNRAQVRNR